MELNENLNKQYLHDKQNFEKIKYLEKDMNDCKQELKFIRRKIEDAEISKKRAEEDNDKKAIEDAKNEIKRLNEEKKRIIKKGKNIAETLNMYQDKVQEHFKEIEKEPELKAYINETMAIKYNRQLNKIHKEQNQLESLRKAMVEKPEIENNLKGMIRANEKIEDLKKELEGLDKIKDKVRIDEISQKEMPEAEKRYKINKDMIMKRVNIDSKIDEEKDGKGAKVTSEFIDSLTKEGFFHYKTDGKDKDTKREFKKGDINLNKSLDRIEKGYAKKEAFYNKSIQKVLGKQEKVSETAGEPINSNKVENGNPLIEVNEKASWLHPFEKIKSWWKDDSKDNKTNQEKVSEVLQNQDNSNKAENKNSLIKVNEKVSWLHPFKKIKSWWKDDSKDNKTNQEKAYETEENQDNNDKVKNKYNKFKEIYKYDLIKDYVENKEEDIRMAVKKEKKNELTGERDFD